MTKRHFAALAALLNREYNRTTGSRRDGVVLSIHAVADACERFNPNFDWERFLEACTAP